MLFDMSKKDDSINDGYDEVGICDQRYNVPRRPSHPHFSSYKSRLQSFLDKKWPIDLRQKPEVLAEAGFFYKGVKDQVHCYMCDGGVERWEEHDDPWVEHKKWYTYCYHLKIPKDQIYQQEYKPLSPVAPLVNPSSLNICSQNEPNINLSVEAEIEKGQGLGPSKRGSDECVVCLEGEKVVLFSSCLHLVCCKSCAEKLTNCPMCRKEISQKVNVFKC